MFPGCPLDFPIFSLKTFPQVQQMSPKFPHDVPKLSLTYVLLFSPYVPKISKTCSQNVSKMYLYVGPLLDNILTQSPCLPIVTILS